MHICVQQRLDRGSHICKCYGATSRRHNVVSAAIQMERQYSHARTDDDDSSSDGGWVCASNSEVSGGDGGVVGAIDYVNSAGEVIWYQMILGGTDRNCGGGKTPWNMWLTTCEEDMERLWI